MRNRKMMTFVLAFSAMLGYVNGAMWVNPNHDTWMGNNQDQTVLDQVGQTFVANTAWDLPTWAIRQLNMQGVSTNALGGIPLVPCDPSLKTTDPLCLQLGASPTSTGLPEFLR